MELFHYSQVTWTQIIPWKCSPRVHWAPPPYLILYFYYWTSLPYELESLCGCGSYQFIRWTDFVTIKLETWCKAAFLVLSVCLYLQRLWGMTLSSAASTPTLMCLCCGFLMYAMLCELWIVHTFLFQQQPNPLWAPTIDLTPHPLSQQTSPTPLGCLAPVLKSCSCLAVVDWLPASVFSRLSACFSSLTSLQLNSLPFFHWSFQSWNSGGQQWEGNKLSVSFAVFFFCPEKLFYGPEGTHACNLNHACTFWCLTLSQRWAKMWHMIHFFILSDL